MALAGSPCQVLTCRRSTTRCWSRRSSTLLAPERGGLFVDVHGRPGRTRRGAAPRARARRGCSGSTATRRRWRSRRSGCAPFGDAGRGWCRRGSPSWTRCWRTSGSSGAESWPTWASRRCSWSGRSGASASGSSGPLDMRMGLAETDGGGPRCNEGSEGELEKIFSEYGEERQARRIARSIVAARREQPIETTGELKRADRARQGPARAAGGGRVDPATLRLPGAAHRRQRRARRAARASSSRPCGCWSDDGRLVDHLLPQPGGPHRQERPARPGARGEIDPVTGRPHAETQLIEAADPQAGARRARKRSPQSPLALGAAARREEDLSRS